jgi:DNA-binding transcriptional ArsR family regulator
MTIHLDVSQLRADHLAFGYSPLQEALNSLHVLANSKRFPLHIPWVIEARKRMSRPLKQEYDRFRLCFERLIITALDLRDSTRLQTFDEELRAFQHASPTRFVDELAFIALERVVPFSALRKDAGLRAAASAHIAELFPTSAAVFQAALKRPKPVRERFAGFLAGYWRACLEADWPDIEARLAQDIALRAHSLRQGGTVARLLNGLGPGIYINPKTGVGTKESRFDAVVTFKPDDVLYLTPSYFLWPRLHFRPESPPGLMYPVQALRRELPAVPPERLVTIARALGDPTRLRILRLIRRRPYSTRELAGRLHLSEAGVSKHLKLLAQADLATSEREGYFVMYQLSTQALSELQRGLGNYLELG